LKHIAVNDLQNDFRFIVDGCTYPCLRSIAEFLSPRISRQRATDPSIAEYVVETRDWHDQFQLFLSLGQGSTIHVDQTNRRFLLSLSQELGNSDLYSSLLKPIPDDSRLGEIYDLSYEDAIPFIARQFYTLTSSTLNGFSMASLYSILSHESLCILNEDSLYSYLCDRQRRQADPEVFNLFQFVRFEYLSDDLVSHVPSQIRGFVDARLWKALYPRLMHWRENTQWSDFTCAQDDSRPFEGIIDHLTRKAGGNIVDKGIVKISSSSRSSGCLRNVVDFACDSCFRSQDFPGQWILWDFNKMRIRPTHWSIRSPDLRHWVLETSLDNTNWIEIDRGSVLSTFDPFSLPPEMDHLDEFPLPDDSAFLDVNWTPRAELSAYDDRRDKSRPPDDLALSGRECRFIRLTQTGKNDSGNDQLVIEAFEVFGTISQGQE
jgi:hypothetical protein